MNMTSYSLFAFTFACRRDRQSFFVNVTYCIGVAEYSGGNDLPRSHLGKGWVKDQAVCWHEQVKSET